MKDKYGVPIDAGDTLSIHWPSTGRTIWGRAVLKRGTLNCEVTNDNAPPSWWLLDWEDDREVTVINPVDPSSDPVNHPAHYTAYPVEVIVLTERMNFCRGNAVKYIARAGLKNPTREAEIEDLRKAEWYVKREIARLMEEG